MTRLWTALRPVARSVYSSSVRRAVLGAVLVTLTAGCTLRAPYKEPVQAPVSLTAADPSLFDDRPYDPKWWRQFEDPVLLRLEETAVQSNYDVLVAVARYDQARAIFDDVDRDKWPIVTVGASVDYREQSFPGFSNEPLRTTTYRAGFDVFWELDVFGRIRSAIRSAAADAEAYEASLADVRVAVAAEVARQYFELRGLQQQLAVAQRSLANQRETLRLTQVRRDAGIGEEQDVASAAARVAAIDARLPPISAEIATREHGLAVLTGRRPGELQEDLSPRAYPPIGKTLPLGDVTSLLRRRPDVRAAERRLASSTALEGVAAAELFPRITMSGVLGLLAGRGNLFGTADSRNWAVTPALTWVGFDLGSARARLRGAEAGTRESLAVYQQTVLRALEETANALVAYRYQQQRLVSLVEQARESERAASIARVRYREGAVDFLELLDAERTQLDADDSVVQAESGVFTRVVAVYKALGGVE